MSPSFDVETTSVKRDPVESRSVEFVERKGLGHPDTVCDGVAEAVSRSLSHRYREEFGRVLHHNTDSVQMVAGTAEPDFGGGEVLEQPTLYLGGQATKHAGDSTVPVEEIATEAARDYLDENLERIAAKDVGVVADLDATSQDLSSLFDRDKVRANDTSVGVGHAPLSDLERTVRSVEPEVRAHEAVGEDVKIMGRRSGDGVRLTVAAAVVGEEVAGIDEYVEVKESVRRLVEENASEQFEDVRVAVNTADDIDEGEVYLTVTGLSVESGDDGAVGRGNRTNGLITPHRPMSIEAVAGKNPVTHVGKLYNVLTRRAAERVSDADGTDGYAEVSLLSEIGRRVDEPACAEVVTTAPEDAAVRAVRDELGRLDELTEEVIEGDVRLF